MKYKLATLVVLALIVLIAGTYLRHLLDLSVLKAHVDLLADWRDRFPILTVLGFMAVYITITGLCLPGAALLTLAAGALFGLVAGTIVISFASSLGALVAFLLSRHVLGAIIRPRFADRMAIVDAGMERDGAFYLFTLRLMPVFPFFLVNMLMGLTNIPVLTFYLVSQAGMLAGTIVYVNAGTQLAGLTSMMGILSPGLMASFIALGLFPWAARYGLSLWQRHRIYRGWARPKQFDRNLIVIGGGAAGLVSAYLAAATKAKVTLVEQRRLGGDCLYTGCVPSKALIRVARAAEEIRRAEGLGLGKLEPKMDFPRVMARVREVIAAIAPHDSIERYQGLGVDVVEGKARIIDPFTVEIALADGGTRRLTSRGMVIATGAEPFVPTIPGLATVDYLTSETLWDRLASMDRPPERLAILGGGPIGCELAQAFARLGSSVTLIELAHRLLIREDEDAADAVRAALAADGVTILTGAKAIGCDGQGASGSLTLEIGGDRHRVDFDHLLLAVGRVPRLTGFGLEDLGIPTAGTITTDAYLQTLFPNIHAAGDVAGPYQLTHAGAHQAWYATVNTLFGELKRTKADYSALPATIFTDPEVARVGLSEQEAKARGIAYEISRYDLDELDRAIADGRREGFVKVLTVPGKDRILGVTIVGAEAGELLAEFTLAMRWGLGLGKILSTVHAYPTLAEANKYVAGIWKRAHLSPQLLALAERYHRWRRGGTA